MNFEFKVPSPKEDKIIWFFVLRCRVKCKSVIFVFRSEQTKVDNILSLWATEWRSGPISGGLRASRQKGWQPIAYTPFQSIQDIFITLRRLLIIILPMASSDHPSQGYIFTRDSKSTLRCDLTLFASSFLLHWQVLLRTTAWTISIGWSRSSVVIYSTIVSQLRSCSHPTFELQTLELEPGICYHITRLFYMLPCIRWLLTCGKCPKHMADSVIRKPDAFGKAWRLWYLVETIPTPTVAPVEPAPSHARCIHSVSGGASGLLWCHPCTLLRYHVGLGQFAVIHWESSDLVEYDVTIHQLEIFLSLPSFSRYPVLTTMLRYFAEPGGYLQWVDLDILSSRAIKPEPSSSPTSATEKLIALMRKPQPNAIYE